MRHPVIAICGRPGAGKTTLARALAKAFAAELICHDDFETFTRRGPDVISDWIDRGAPYAEIEAPGLREAVEMASATRPVLFDTPLGAAWPKTARFITLGCWLEVDADVALARKLSQMMDGVPTGQERAFLDWSRSFLDQQATIVNAACRIQKTRVAPTCQIHLNGHLSAQELSTKAEGLIRSHLSERSDR